MVQFQRSLLNEEPAQWKLTRVFPEMESVVIANPRDALTAKFGTALTIFLYYGMVTTIQEQSHWPTCSINISISVKC